MDVGTTIETASATAPLRLLLVSGDDSWTSHATEAAARLGAAIVILPTVDAALAWMLRPERLCTHVLAAGRLDLAELDALAGMVDEVTSRPTPLLLLGGDGRGYGPAVLTVKTPSSAAIAAVLHHHQPFLPPDLPCLTEHDLRFALHDGALRMRFQPIVDSHTLDVIGLEALARLHHSTLGILRPKDFLPQAIASGQERAFTGIAAARTMLELKPLQGHHGRSFALNVPLTTLCHAYSAERGAELCAVAGLKPDRVTIEVVETATLPDLHQLARGVDRWRKFGFAVTIDDAGPGLPHWRQMLTLPFTGLKLDGSLALGGRATASQAEEIVDAAKRHGLMVVAEGIEDLASVTRMRGFGVDAFQGFLFARPLPARALPIWLREWRSGELARQGQGSAPHPVKDLSLKPLN